MQFKSILISLVASAALAQAVEYATYDLCWKELNGYWSSYGQGRLTLEVATMNAVDCGFCILAVQEKCIPKHTCQVDSPELEYKQCFVDAVLACEIPIFTSSVPAVAAASV